jgi:hypothetical protein
MAAASATMAEAIAAGLAVVVTAILEACLLL